MGSIEIAVILLAVLGVILLGTAIGAYWGLHGPAKEATKILEKTLENTGIAGAPIHVTVPIPEQLVSIFGRIEIILWGMMLLAAIIAFAGLLDLMKFWAFLRRRRGRG